MFRHEWTVMGEHKTLIQDTAQFSGISKPRIWVGVVKYYSLYYLYCHNIFLSHLTTTYLDYSEFRTMLRVHTNYNSAFISGLTLIRQVLFILSIYQLSTAYSKSEFWMQNLRIKKSPTPNTQILSDPESEKWIFSKYFKIITNHWLWSKKCTQIGRI